MSLNIRALLTMACAAVASAALPLHATLIQTYSTLSALEAASTGLQTITFDGTAPSGGSTSYSTSAGYTADSVNFVGVEGNGAYSLNDFDTTQAWYYNFDMNDALLMYTNPGSVNPYFQITLPPGVTACGVNLASGNPYGLSFSVVVNGMSYSVSGSTSNPTSTTAGTPVFFGATFDAPITTIDIYPLNYVPADPTWALLDNFSFGAAADPPSTAPEGSTLLLIGSGLVGLASSRKFRRRSPTQTA